jgi:thiamine pyrophosphate-dependent acetolactate synthase large subunit-like protein
LALQNADVVFLMGARFNWIFHPRFLGNAFRQAAPLCPNVKAIHRDIAAEEIGTTIARILT